MITITIEIDKPADQITMSEPLRVIINGEQKNNCFINGITKYMHGYKIQVNEIELFSEEGEQYVNLTPAQFSFIVR